MDKWITTWFYTQSHSEGGAYAQVSGDSSTEEFRDVYRRCLAVFFQSARRANPEARLTLYLNEPWDSSASDVALRVGEILRSLAVHTKVITYEHRPPSTFSKSWRNQFFVLDVLEDLAGSVEPADVWLVLDSDIVWSGISTEEMWNTLASEGLSTYEVGYAPEKLVNGLSVQSLGELGRVLELEKSTALNYSGGEFIGGRGDMLPELSKEAHNTWSSLMAFHANDNKIQFEEAHLLSLAYSTLGIVPGGMNPFTRRLWTQPFKVKNVKPSDRTLTLWHVPAEKKYGIRRMYRRLTTSDPTAYISMSDIDWESFCQRELGIPKNSIVKVARDVTTAVRARLLAKVLK